jgi:hypothetical protein
MSSSTTEKLEKEESKEGEFEENFLKHQSEEIEDLEEPSELSDTK